MQQLWICKCVTFVEFLINVFPAAKFKQNTRNMAKAGPGSSTGVGAETEKEQKQEQEEDLKQQKAKYTPN